MKRTVEVVLSIIGAFVYSLGALFGGLFRMLDGENEMMQDLLREDPQLTESDIADVQMLLDGVGSVGTMLIVGSIIAIVAGIVAMIFFKGNSKPKAASIILLVVGVVTTIITFGLAIFAGIFYIIAGIMGLVRKPKQEINMEQY
ncbi:DUF4064 domain-containing protein [Gracilibacillus salitolerans]|uniref:DUF4064 domain-containing protein n=1 Tax=Gracilibacillus salitolerans TaxID=2663022 RepID=A0A5Q2TFT9_9BACI|nr:DUF4064 domain-containing protein [Gracilibacillus salitolerans]QGH33077.1 DUF4064 domain-containing protein [Gracilibacillus salitolerans]